MLRKSMLAVVLSVSMILSPLAGGGINVVSAADVGTVGALPAENEDISHDDSGGTDNAGFGGVSVPEGEGTDAAASGGDAAENGNEVLAPGATENGVMALSNGEEGTLAAQADDGTAVKVFFEDDFDSYEAKEFIRSANGGTPSVSLGNLQFLVGTDGKATVAAAIEAKDESNKHVKITYVSGALTALRGFQVRPDYSAVGAPNPTALKESGLLLSLSMDITSAVQFRIVDSAVVASYEDASDKNAWLNWSKGFVVPAMTEERHMQMIIDAKNGKRYVVLSDMEGNFVSCEESAYTASEGVTEFASINFFDSGSNATFDNLKIEQTAVTTVVVKNGDTPVEGATVQVGDSVAQTDAEGKAWLAVSAGTHNVTVSKPGYKASADNAATVTVDSADKTFEFKLDPDAYDAEPKEVTVGGGQNCVGASKDNTPAQSEAFTVSVKDQMGVVMESGYTVAWKILPEGQAEANPAVTIDKDGVVSVSKDFNTENKVEVYIVTATVTANGKSAEGTTTVYIGNSGAIYYNPLNIVMQGADRGLTTNLGDGISLPDVCNVTLDVTYTTKPKTQLSIALITDGGRLTGTQYVSETDALTAWTEWTGNTALNQWNDVGMFKENGVVAESVNGSTVKVCFNVDKTAHTVTASCGDKTIVLPYTDTFSADKLLSIQWGKHEKDGAAVINSIFVEEAEASVAAPEITGKSSITKAKDSSVVEAYTVKSSIEGETFTWDVKTEAGGSATGVSIAADGKLTVEATAAAGEYIITATSTTDTARKAELTVTVREAPSADAANYLVINATGNETAIDSSAIIPKDTSKFITGYQITTATADKKLVKQEIVAELPATVDTTGAAKVEIAPVYVTNISGVNKDLLHLGGAGNDICNIELPEAGTYNFKVTNTLGSRVDVYVNGQMLVNNLCQNAAIPNFKDVHDIKLTDKVAQIRTDDYGSGDAGTQKFTVQIVKAPGIVDRVRKVYVLGDSLVCIYYNGGSPENKDAQTGWGQLIDAYLTEDVEVVDLANSGSTAHSLESTAYSQIHDSAETGDILLLESAYNDQTPTKDGYFDNGGTDNYMAVALKKMVADAKAKGMEVILVSPNASLKPYRGTPAWTTRMEEVVTELNASGKTVDYIDLGQLSFDFLSETYGPDAAGATEAMEADYVISDQLHSKYNAAQKYASLVAGALKDIIPDIVNTDYYYTYMDINGQTIFCTAGEIPADQVVTLTYEMNGHGKEYGSTRVIKGAILKAMTPTESGWAFRGWYKDAELTQKWDFATDKVGTADFTLYAKWEERKGELYYQDFEEVEKVTDVASAPNGADQMKIASDTGHGNYLIYDWTTAASQTGDRGLRMDFTGLDVSDKDAYIIEFDAMLKDSDEKVSQLVVMDTAFTYTGNNVNYGAGSGYLFKMAGKTNYTLNDSDSAKFTITSGAWCHYTLYVDKKAGNGLISTTIVKEGETAPVADKVVTAYNGNGNAAGIYMLAGRKQSVIAIDNILVREVTADDEFGDVPQENVKEVVFTSQLNRVITQAGGSQPQHFPITVKVVGDQGGDYTAQSSVKWSMLGMDQEKDAGYISLTKEEGTDLGTTGVTPDGAATAYFNVRDGVSNLFGYIQAEVTYGDKTWTVRTPVAVLSSATAPDNRLAPDAGYPVNMNDYDSSLIGILGTASSEKDRDIVLNNWSIYGSNGARSFSLEEFGGKQALKFSSTGGSGPSGNSTLAVYQWSKQTSQYVMDLTVSFTAAMTFGVYSKTSNVAGPGPEWEVSYSSGELKLGTKSISGINANEWYRILVSADPSINKVSLKAYNSAGELMGSIEDVDMGSSDARYLCFNGTFPMYLNSFEAYRPLLGTLTVNSAADAVKVPETEGSTADLDLTATLLSTEGLKMTGTVTWTLAEDYPNVELVPNGDQKATLKVSAGASGMVTVVASRDGKQTEKSIQLTTSSNTVSFTSSASSINIPFAGEEAVVKNFTAVTLDKDGKEIDGGAITYTLLEKDAMTPLSTLPKGVTFENGVMTVEPGANPAVLYVKATNGEGLSAKAKVNIHGLSFVFGSADAAEGYTQVTKELYTERLGYGFWKTEGLTVNTDNVTGTEDFRFKVAVPNGNYTVMVDTTADKMTSEVVESVTTCVTGIEKTGTTFNVAVCDGVLDLTFPAGSSVKTVEISQMAPKAALPKPMVYVIGDSTASNTNNGAKSWGNCVAAGDVSLPDVFGGFENRGWGGKNSVSYYNGASVEGVLLSICPGDYVTVNMGINWETGEPVAYPVMLRDYYVEGILQRGGIPVIMTATPDGPVGDRLGMNYNAATGKFTNSRGSDVHNDDLRNIAKEKNLTIIELGQWGENWMNTLTMENVAAYNKEYNTSFTSVLEMVQSWYVDHNHYKQYLGIQIGNYVLGELAKLAGAEPDPSPSPDVSPSPSPDVSPSPSPDVSPSPSPDASPSPDVSPSPSPDVSPSPSPDASPSPDVSPSPSPDASPSPDVSPSPSPDASPSPSPEAGNVVVVPPVSGEKAPEATLKTPADMEKNLKDSGYLNSEAIKQIEEGAKCEVSMSIKDADTAGTVTAEEKKAVGDVISGLQNSSEGRYEAAQYIDISLSMILRKEGQPIAGSEKELKELHEELEITIKIPDSLINTDPLIQREYIIIRVHDGKPEKLDNTQYNEAAKELTFRSGLFSTYVLVTRDTNKPESEDPAPDDDDDNAGGVVTGVITTGGVATTAVKTGDNMNVVAMVCVIILIAAAAGAGVVIMRKRRNGTE